MITEEIRAIVEYLAKQKLKGILVVLILIPALFISFKWVAPNPDSTSSEEQPEQAELQEEEVAEEPIGETPTQPASRGGDSRRFSAGKGGTVHFCQDYARHFSRTKRHSCYSGS